jgi:hypothetical protein
LFKLIVTGPKDWREILAALARDIRLAGDLRGNAGVNYATRLGVRRVRTAFDPRIVEYTGNAVRQKTLPRIQAPHAGEAPRVDEQMEKTGTRLRMASPGFSPRPFARKGAFSSSCERWQPRVASGVRNRIFPVFKIHI